MSCVARENLKRLRSDERLKRDFPDQEMQALSSSCQVLLGTHGRQSLLGFGQNWSDHRVGAEGRSQWVKCLLYECEHTNPCKKPGIYSSQRQVDPGIH